MCYLLFAAVVGVLIYPVAGFLIYPASAQEIHHHDGQSKKVDEFYSTWFRPDNPAKSCCNKMDCSAAQAYLKNGQWIAKRAGDTAWRAVPREKIETGRDSPDGRSHLCAPRGDGDENTVFCFIPGSGT